MREYSTYMVLCSDGSYYIGVTNDVTRRLGEHNDGINPGCYTFKRRPVILVYMESFKYIDQAIGKEKQLKGWSRKKKEALIAKSYERLPDLSMCTNASSHYYYNTVLCHAERARRAVAAILNLPRLRSG